MIDKFYRDDSSKIITRVQNLAKAAEDNFWKNVEDGLGFLKDDSLRWTMHVDVKKRDDLTTFDLAKMAIEESRTDSFVEHFEKLKLSASPRVVEEKPTDEEQAKLEIQPSNQQLKSHIPNLMQTISIDDMLKLDPA
ncbi:hypothetical protein [Maridesulfovibrio sp.]|uniref:hypothetical protein n=1 Tax=unclassified Maridesulfovibrio TaxID=2794999 RepID=UPI003B00AA6F